MRWLSELADLLGTSTSSPYHRSRPSTRPTRCHTLRSQVNSTTGDFLACRDPQTCETGHLTWLKVSMVYRTVRGTA